jgi:hypothetical protein
MALAMSHFTTAARAQVARLRATRRLRNCETLGAICDRQNAIAKAKSQLRPLAREW